MLHQFRASECSKGQMIIDGIRVDIAKLNAIVAGKPIVHRDWDDVKGMARKKGWSACRQRKAAAFLDRPGLIMRDGTLVDGRHRSRARRESGFDTGLYRVVSKADLKKAAVKKFNTRGPRLIYFGGQQIIDAKTGRTLDPLAVAGGFVDREYDRPVKDNRGKVVGHERAPRVVTRRPGGGYDEYGGANMQVVRAAYRKANEVRRHAERGGRLVSDVGDLIHRRGRKKDTAGRPKKREWEKPWFRNAAIATGGAVATLGGLAVLRRSPKLRSKVHGAYKGTRDWANRRMRDAFPDTTYSSRQPLIEFAGGYAKHEIVPWNRSQPNVHVESGPPPRGTRQAYAPRERKPPTVRQRASRAWGVISGKKERQAQRILDRATKTQVGLRATAAERGMTGSGYNKRHISATPREQAQYRSAANAAGRAEAIRRQPAMRYSRMARRGLVYGGVGTLAALPIVGAVRKHNRERQELSKVSKRYMSSGQLLNKFAFDPQRFDRTLGDFQKKNRTRRNVSVGVGSAVTAANAYATHRLFRGKSRWALPAAALTAATGLSTVGSWAKHRQKDRFAQKMRDGVRAKYPQHFSSYGTNLIFFADPKTRKHYPDQRDRSTWKKNVFAKGYRMPHVIKEEGPAGMALYIDRRGARSPQVREAFQEELGKIPPRTQSGGIIITGKPHPDQQRADAAARKFGYQSEKQMRRAGLRHEIVHSIQDFKRGYPEKPGRIRDLVRDEIGAYKAQDKKLKRNPAGKGANRVLKAAGVVGSTGYAVVNQPHLRARAARYGLGATALAGTGLGIAAHRRAKKEKDEFRKIQARMSAKGEIIQFAEDDVYIRDRDGRVVLRATDARGRSARIHTGDSRPRERRRKRWDEKLENERALRNTITAGSSLAALGTGVVLGRRIGRRIIPPTQAHAPAPGPQSGGKIKVNRGKKIKTVAPSPSAPAQPSPGQHASQVLKQRKGRGRWEDQRHRHDRPGHRGGGRSRRRHGASDLGRS